MNDKSILVIHTPNTCKKCPIRLKGEPNEWCWVLKHGLDDISKKPDWCPLRPMPQKKEIKHAIYLTKDKNKPTAIGYEAGWNECLKEILGEKIR